MELVSNPTKDGHMTLIARLRIILNDVDPQPMRQIEVPLKLRLDRLHWTCTGSVPVTCSC